MPTLPLSEGHVMYYRERGDSAGIPAIILHGGPGGALEPSVPRRSFDLTRWRVIQFDQRGCGRSRPSGLAGLRANTTWHLVADIERLRVHLGIDRWLVFGGSWGSTLALAYAITHPDRVTGLVLRGIYLGQPWETDWLYKEGGASRVRPEEWRRFVAPIPLRLRGRNVTRTYGRLLRSRDRRTRRAAARAWSRWENSLSFLKPRPDSDTDTEKENMALIENHYFDHGCWLRPGQLLKGAVAPTLSRIPTIIVQGQYDLVCPPAAAAQLKEAMPHASLRLIPDAGHAGSEPGTAAALRKATDEMLKLIK
jgi:proline iminopeptidase